MAGGPAHALSGQPVDLGKGARHQHIVRRHGKLQPTILLFFGKIFDIGMIEHQQHVGRQGRMQTGQLRRAGKRPGGVVGVGQKNHPRIGRDCGEQPVDIRSIIAVRHFHRRGAAFARDDVIERKAIAHIQDLIARPGIALRGQPQKLPRSGAADDPGRVDPVRLADRVP